MSLQLAHYIRVPKENTPYLHRLEHLFLGFPDCSVLGVRLEVGLNRHDTAL